MIIGTAISKNGVKIRLTEERWFHITYSHKEVDSADFTEALATVKNPDFILKGDAKEHLYNPHPGCVVARHMLLKCHVNSHVKKLVDKVNDI